MTKQTETTVAPTVATKQSRRKSKPIELDDLFKQSGEKESFDPTIEVFMGDVMNYKELDKLKLYVASELRRVIKLGKSPLKAIYQNQQHVDYCGSKVILDALSDAGISHVHLRLSDEAVSSNSCPPRDPHGALINEEYRGKILVAKVGNAGGNVGINESMEANRKYTGSGRKLLFSTRKAYDVEVVTEESKRYPITKAMLILAQWGFGCRTRRQIKQDVNKFQDSWLVVEDNIEETYADFLDNDVSDKYINGI